MRVKHIFHRFVEGLPVVAMLSMGSFLGIVLAEVHGRVVVGAVSLCLFLAVAIPSVACYLRELHKAKVEGG